MNYFPFHLGDYAAHTAHLDPLEDLAYRRMIDAYYLREGPLPTDIKEVARIVRLRKNIAEVEAVLREFFTLTDNGWMQDRCDLEIAKMQEKQETLSEKDQHEKDRMQRFRERRSVMFAALRLKEIVPAWDISMKELQRLFDDNCNGPATDLKRLGLVTGNADATAIPTPTPTPTPKIREAKASSSSAKLPTCQTQSVVDLYHEILPNLPKVRLHTKDRVKAIRKVWDWVLTSQKPDHSRRAETAEQALEWFRSYFERATDNDFLMGRTPRQGVHADWQCDIDFLLTDRGMKQVIEKTREAA